ncbi:hypothetical protein V1477_016452 [Vespula maculifrons]|uniref:Uncharacterized protein n=1 Tax=Vespula maculifrons TaxID=7453 RepID=A0ABD2B9F5_VESMC
MIYCFGTIVCISPNTSQLSLFFNATIESLRTEICLNFIDDGIVNLPRSKTCEDVAGFNLDNKEITKDSFAYCRNTVLFYECTSRRFKYSINDLTTSVHIEGYVRGSRMV